MTIKQQGGIFGRNPTFNDLTIEGTLTATGTVTVPADSISGNAINGGTATLDGLTVDTDTLYVDAPNDRVGINTSNPTTSLQVNTGAGGFGTFLHSSGAGGLRVTGAAGASGANIILANDFNSGGDDRWAFTLNGSNDSLSIASGGITSGLGGSGTERINVDTSGNMSLKTGNLVVASGSGIDFSATSDGSGTTTSELFDDYEEGVFEPSFGGATSDPTVTYDNPNETSGIYRKIGSLVFFSLSLRTSGATGGSGRLLIKGLPFTCATGLGESASCSAYVGYSSSFGTNPTMGTVEANTTQIGLRYRATHNANASNSDVTHLSNSSASNYIYIAGSYVAA